MQNFLIYVIIWFVSVLLQFVFAKYFSVWGLFPNIALIITVYFGFKKGPVPGQLFGFFAGLSWDLIAVDFFGARALILAWTGFFSGRFAKKWDETKSATQIFLVIFFSCIFWAGIKTISYLFGENDYSFRPGYRELFQIIYNIILTPIIFKIIEFIDFKYTKRSAAFHDI